MHDIGINAILGRMEDEFARLRLKIESLEDQLARQGHLLQSLLVEAEARRKAARVKHSGKALPTPPDFEGEEA